MGSNQMEQPALLRFTLREGSVLCHAERVPDEAEAERRRKIVERIARQNGVTPDDVEAQADQLPLNNTYEAAEYHEPTYEEKVLSRLTVIAWSTAIVAVVTIVGVIILIVSAANAHTSLY
jgi:hypothetical protein